MLIQGSSNTYGNVHQDTETFKQEFQKKHSKEDKIGEFDASELYKTDKEDDVFYWFSLHDHNHDGHLDGHELRQAWMASDPTIYTLAKAEDVVDKILEQDDLDNDGRISWEEYLSSQSASS